MSARYHKCNTVPIVFLIKSVIWQCNVCRKTQDFPIQYITKNINKTFVPAQYTEIGCSTIQCKELPLSDTWPVCSVRPGRIF